MAIRIRTAVVLFLVAVVTLCLAPLVRFGLATGLWRGKPLLRAWHRTVAWALGLRISTHGTLARERPLLVVSNHVSWTDITVLGAIADVCFIAKSEMSGWPLMGWLSTLQRTVFVDRKKRRASGLQAGEIAARLAVGDAMVLFAEGTTGDGNRLLPFKSTLFGAAAMMLSDSNEETVWVQPVAIAYTRVHGLPMGRAHRPIAAWIGDEDLLPHVSSLLRNPAVDVEVHFGEPVAMRVGGNRKTLSRTIEKSVQESFSAALAGRRK